MPSMLCCSPVPVPSPAIGGVGLVATPPPPPLSLRRKVHVQDDMLLPAAVMAVNPACDAGDVVREEREPMTSVEAPAKKKKAARWRPPRLVVPAVADAYEEAMSAVAAKAEKEKMEEEVEGEGFWMVSRRGMRHAMEDGYGVITHKIDVDSKMAFYGVYDGHGGRAAVDFVADRLGSNVVAAAEKAKRSSEEASPSSLPAAADHVADAIRAAYVATDSEFLSKGARGGACAATALVIDGNLYVANLGDCRAVLSRHGAATALTSDHTPARDDERTRIETSGGYVSCGSNGVWRVQDNLAVTRAFGDGGLKRWVVAEPEVSRTRLAGAGAGGGCEFLVVASDGLWNKVSNQEAVDAVAAAVAAGGEHSVEPCRRLVEMARRRGSRDDVTVMVVDLKRFLIC